ncbi:hypothetical protein M422DRAFT_46588 [Sphaerobolus stellatus SS14]|uniref:F-box domain-containing protein n=1 Tax=Sphaerobolus stellatus (strain SS14) TaxID=990650 RepID=A0A0C9W362_SPHS4|nr:hypothetical protein M422DRAFT_46588 [Sphaerobolus stellatus SS14]
MITCSICLLPFLAGDNEPSECQAPPQVLSAVQARYLKTGVAIGVRVPDVIYSLEILSAYFISLMLYEINLRMIEEINHTGRILEAMFVFWEFEHRNGTAFIVHNACANIFRHHLGIGMKPSYDDLIKLCEIEQVLGSPKGGKLAGRMQGLNYEDIGPVGCKIDLRPFWEYRVGRGCNRFLWTEFFESPLSWALGKPDTFPKFYSTVNGERLKNLDQSEKQKGFPTLPIDILNLIIPLLSTKDYINVMSTCRTLRLIALTEFQAHARKRVLSLRWATPLLDVGEFDEAVKQNPKTSEWLAHPINAPDTGDWILYLSHVHRTNGMRARRRIWYICEAFKELYDEKYPKSLYARNISTARRQLENNLRKSQLNVEAHRRLMHLSELGWEQNSAHAKVKADMGLDSPIPM